jgi:hypothetical protein
MPNRAWRFFRHVFPLPGRSRLGVSLAGDSYALDGQDTTVMEQPTENGRGNHLVPAT